MELIVDKEFINTRLDRFIRRKYSGANSNYIFKLINNGKIKVNYKKKRHSYRLQDNDVIIISDNLEFLIKKSIIKISNQDFNMVKSSIVFENDKILILNKPAGYVMHKGSGFEYGITDILKSYTNNPDFSFVNRIDKATSGLIIGAKNMDTIRTLSALIMEKKVEKHYYILVDGIPEQENFTITSYLTKTDKGVFESASYAAGSRISRSTFKTIQKGLKRCILEATLDTGRTHQLRVQLSNQNLPIVGDLKYGKSKLTKMCLFSHRVVVDKYDLDVNLDIPNYFVEELI